MPVTCTEREPPPAPSRPEPLLGIFCMVGRFFSRLRMAGSISSTSAIATAGSSAAAAAAAASKLKSKRKASIHLRVTVETATRKNNFAQSPDAGVVSADFRSRLSDRGRILQ